MEDKRKKALPFTLCAVGKCWEKQQPAIKRPHGAEWHQFIWVIGGSGTFRMENETFVLKEGEGAFTRAGIPNFYEGEDLRTEWFTFDCDEAFLNYVLGDKDYFIFMVPSFLRRETEDLIRSATGNSTSLELSALAYSYVIKLFEAVLKNEDTIITKVVDYMQNNYHAIVSLDGIAEEVGMDKFALCRLYKQKCGRTIIDDLLKIRIGKAKRMLRYGNESVENIGRACGFETPSYFCKKFRLIVGSTPLQYRKKHM